MRKRITCLLILCILLVLAGCAAAHSSSSQHNLDNGTHSTFASSATAVTTATTKTLVSVTEPPVTTEFPVETMPLLPQGTVHITAPFDVFADDPENAGDVEMHIVEGDSFLKNVVDEWFHIYRLGGNHFAIGILPQITDEDFADMTLRYEASTNWDGFYTSPKLSESYAGSEVSFEEYIYWIPTKHDPMNAPERVWIDVVVRANDNIVGMAVFEIKWNGSFADSRLIYMYSEGYRLIDGKFQNITEEFVNARIEAYHQYAAENAE